MDNDLTTLIQQSLDGANSPEEESRLTALLAEDASARTAMDEMIGLVATLKSQPLVDPPVDFTKRVMASLPVRTAPRPDPVAWWNSMLDLVLGHRLALAYAAVAGVIIVTATVFTLSTPGGILPATGTMGAGVEMSQDVHLPGIQGSVTLLQQPDEVVVRIELDSADGALVTIMFDDELLTFLRVEPEGAGRATGSGEVEVAVSGRSEWRAVFAGSVSDAAIPMVTVRGPDGSVERLGDWR